MIGHAVSLRDGYAEGMSDAMLYSDHNLVAMCAECNAGLGGASIPPYRLLLIFSLHAHHVVVVADGHGGVFEGRQRVAGVCLSGPAISNATPFFLEVIPLAPLVSADPIALT